MFKQFTENIKGDQVYLHFIARDLPRILYRGNSYAHQV